MSKFTIFKNIKDSKNPHYVSLDYIVNRIKSNRDETIINQIRILPEKKDRDKIKMNLPSICFSGIFTHRANKAITQHSGLIALDFDHLTDPEAFKNQLKKDKYIRTAFISPSGDGLKVIIAVPPSIENHRLYCKALKEYFKNENLDNFEDEARVCYISSDPEIYYNPASVIFAPEIKKEKIKKEIQTGYIRNYDVIYDNLIKWIEKYDNYQDGNKHNFLVKLAGACNRFGIPKDISIQKITATYQHRASKVKGEDFEKIISRVYFNYRGQNGISHFDEKGTAIDTITKVKVQETFFNEIDILSKDIIFLDNVKESMIDGFYNGKAKGTTTYFKEFDHFWKWKRKELTFWSGIGNMGKSTWVLQLALIKAYKEDFKFGVFSPEQDPPDDFYNDLVHMYIGKSTEPGHPNQMTIDEYHIGIEFVKKHFFYVYPENASPTPEYINQVFKILIEKYGIDGAITDPFNQLDNDWRKYNRDDLYISDYLSKEKRFAQDHNIFKFIIGHPKGNLSKTAQGDYMKPNVYDYSGGAMWNNKCDNILCYHRPYATSDPENTKCEWTTQKIKKRKLVGKPGTIEVNFDILSQRFYVNNFNPLPVFGEDNEIKSNTLFEAYAGEVPF